MLVGGAPRPGGCWSDFDLLTDNQAITWLKTHKHLNMMYVRWLDEIEDFLFKFDVTHLPGARSPTNQLSRRGFTDCDGPAASTGESDAESQQELVFTPRPRRSRPGGARSRPRPMGDTPARGGSFTNIPGVGRDSTHTTPPGAGANSPRCWYVHRTRRCGASARYRHNGCPIATTALPSSRHCRRSSQPTRASGRSCAAAALGTLFDRHGAPLVDCTNTPMGGTFLVRCGLPYSQGQGEVDRLCIPAGGGQCALVLREC